MTASKKAVAKVTLPAAALKAVAAAHKAAGPNATPAGTSGSGSKPFKVGAKSYASMPALAQSDPATFATVTAAALVKGGASRTRAGSLMAHRTRILKAAGIN